MKRYDWVWAVGIEDTFIGQRQRGERRLDEYELTQHDRFWREDLERARELGVSMIRYGIPWYKVEPEPGVFDWSWVDEVMAYFAEHRDLVPILDFVHYGTPLWMKNEFMNGSYPEHAARYAAEFAKRYKDVVKFYTPLNEPFINAEWCGWSGTWPPYLTGQLGFVLMMNQLCKGIIRTVRAIQTVQPEHPLHQWVVERGISEVDLAWYREHRIEPDIVGVNYYPQFSINRVDEDVVAQEQIASCVPGRGQALVEIASDLYRRYGKPIFITETSYRGTVQERIDWMRDLVEACLHMQLAGVDLYGVTWFPFLDMIDWPYRTNGRPLAVNMAEFGLYTLQATSDGALLRIRNETAEIFEKYCKG